MTIPNISVSTRHTLGTDSMTVVDAVMTGTICGPNVSGQWTYICSTYTVKDLSFITSDVFIGIIQTSIVSSFFVNIHLLSIRNINIYVSQTC